MMKKLIGGAAALALVVTLVIPGPRTAIAQSVTTVVAPALAALLTTIDGRVDGIETLLTAIDGRVDGLEALVTSTNGYVDGLEALDTTISGLMTGATGLKFTSTTGVIMNEHAVKASAGTLYSITATNTNAEEVYLRCEADVAAGTAPGSETVELDLAIPGATTAGGFHAAFPQGMAFATGITCWLSSSNAASDSAGEVATDEVKILYTFK